MKDNPAGRHNDSGRDLEELQPDCSNLCLFKVGFAQRDSAHACTNTYAAELSKSRN